MQKGFRAKTLTEQHALSIAITNIDKTFIAMWINTRVEHWLKEIQENIAKLEVEGFSHGAALATTMLDSFFVNNIELYFKLTGNPFDTDACSNLYERMENIKSERARNAEISNQIKAMEEENHRLSDQVEVAQLKFLNCRLPLAPSRAMMPIILHDLMIQTLLFYLLTIQMKSFLCVVLFQILMVRNGLYDMLI